MNLNQVHAGQMFRQDTKDNQLHFQQRGARNQVQADGYGGWQPAHVGIQPARAVQQGMQAQFVPPRNIRRRIYRA